MIDITEQIIYILPGFITMEVFYFIAKARRKRTWEFGLWSLIISIPIMGAIKTLQDITPYYFFDYLPMYVLMSWSSAVAIGIILWLIYKKRLPDTLINKILKESVLVTYNNVFEYTVQNNANSFFKFNTKKGEVYIGKIFRYTLGLEDEEQEIFIRPAIIAITKGDKLIGKNYYYDGSYFKMGEINTFDILGEDLIVS